MYGASAIIILTLNPKIIGEVKRIHNYVYNIIEAAEWLRTLIFSALKSLVISPLWVRV